MESNSNTERTLLEVKGLKKHFPIEAGFLKRTVGYVYAVDDVSFSIPAGKTLGLVGESGCGKTTLGRCVVRALPITDGNILLNTGDGQVELGTMTRSELRPVRRHIQMVFQDPYLSLNPRKTILDIVGEPLRINKIAEGSALENRVRELVDMVGLNIKYLNRYPHAFSGGQRQRIGIARALALNPELIVCDEPVSALDIGHQLEVMEIARDYARRGGGVVAVMHELNLTAMYADRLALLHGGRMARQGHPSEVLTDDLLSRVYGCRVRVNAVPDGPVPFVLPQAAGI